MVENPASVYVGNSVVVVVEVLDGVKIEVLIEGDEGITVGTAPGAVVDITSGLFGQKPQKGAPGRQAAGHISPLRQN